MHNHLSTEEFVSDFITRFIPEPNSGCHLWMGSVSDKGYGICVQQKKVRSAHRIAFEIASGSPIPEGLEVCHRCDVRSCVNPDHLFLGTGSDNVRDSVRKGRHHFASKTHCPKGHEYTPENTWRGRQIGHNGTKRNCRACGREANQRYYAKKVVE